MVSVEGNELVIRIGIATLAFAAENCDLFAEYPNNSFAPYKKVADASALAHDVVAELNREEEDGTTPVHLLIDHAIFDAYENGSEGFPEE